MEIAMRSSCRTRLTKLINNANELLKSETFDPIEAAVLVVRIKSARDTLNAANEKVAPSIESDQFEAECERILEYEDNAVSAIAYLEQRMAEAERKSSQVREGSHAANAGVGTPGGIEERQRRESAGEGRDLDRSPNAEQDQVPSCPPVAQMSNGGTYNKMSVRLPKLELIKFDGDHQQWPAFWEQYDVAIHSNNALSDSDKFAYLKSVLTGNAAVTIQGLTSSKTSYNDAIQLLTNEYSNNARIIDAYIQQLLSLTPVKSRNDILSLRKLYNTTSKITMSLQQLGISVNNYGMMVKSIILKNLPFVMRVEFNKMQAIGDSEDNEHGDDARSLVDLVSGVSSHSEKSFEKQICKLLSYIKLEVDSVEQARVVSEKTEKDDNKLTEKSKFNRNRVSGKDSSFTAAGLLTTVSDQCLFCKSKKHLTVNCNGNLTLTQKKDILKQNSRCFRCTRPNHSSKFCKSKDIHCSKCKKRHATTMCDPKFVNPQTTPNNEPNEENSAVSTTGNATNLLMNGLSGGVYLQTASVFLKSQNNENDVFIRLIIDGGSQLTFIKECISRKLDLPIIGTHRISILTFGTNSRAPARLYNRVQVQLQNQFNDEIVTITAIEVPEICFEALNPPSLTDPVIRKFAVTHRLADINAQKRNINGITLLVGADNYWQLVTGETERLSATLTAVNSKLGWTLHGRQNTSETSNFMVNLNMATVLHAQTVSNEIEFDFDLKNVWDLETIGINGNINCSNEFTEQFIKDKISFKNGRYEVSLPWDSDAKILDSNYLPALGHLKNLTNRLCKSDKLNEYDNAIREYVNNDCAEIVNSDRDGELVYYMPHRPVYREDKETTKVRVVFNASAHAPGSLSLNSLLHSGENLLPDLLKILMNFRCGSIALIADIEKAFLQISVAEEDRDFQRFIWYREPIKLDIKSVTELPPLQTYRMKRVTFGVTTSPFLLAATLRRHLQDQPSNVKDVADVLLNSFYVDDLIVAVSSREEACNIYRQSIHILQSANMNLRKWCSNDPEIMRSFFERPCQTTRQEQKKVLGIFWHTATDELSIDLGNILNAQNHNLTTKRVILQTMSKLYDPMGIIAPFTVRAKILLQKIWKQNLTWDAILPEDLINDWRQWCAEISLLANYSIPRCVIKNKTNEVELHLFADASTQAYGTVAYIKCLESKECTIFLSKNRICPLNAKGDKSLTLPKLELTAALCAARLQSFILENANLKVKSITLWSDSKIALYWIRGNSQRWKPYVKNRVTEICNITKGQWRYCPGKDNPADLLTRGVSSKILTESEIWLHGPTWLSRIQSEWPDDEYYDLSETSEITNCLVHTDELPKTIKQPIFLLNRYRELDKMLRITAYVKRFVNNAKPNTEKLFGRLTVNELNNAETYWITMVQTREFPEEFALLSKKKTLGNNSSILTLNPFMEKEVMRLGGRLGESSLTYESRHPIILPSKSEYTDKVIWKSHENVNHSGVNATLAATREKYWIVRGRQRVKTVIGSCLKCRKLKGKSANEPFAPLPKDRITVANPFKIVGVDFAGPLYVTANEGKSKAYIMLLTCAVVRAVHLELVPDLTAENCLKGLRRFIARRGVPTKIYSDNAKTFKRASLELKELFNLLASKEIQDFSQKQRIQWCFIVERASWWGGFWERLVKTVKDALKITLGKANVGYEEMRTILTEVEATVNSRPLTYIDDDPSNLLILSPSKFLIGACQDEGLSFNPNLPELKRNDILKLWRYRETIVTKFWKRWSADYLQQLRSAHHMKPVKSSNFTIGSIALLHDQHLPRLHWKLVRITNTFQGRDGRIRACEFRTANGDLLRRPIQLLYPLEVGDSPPGQDVKNMTNDATEPPDIGKGETSEVREEPARDSTTVGNERPESVLERRNEATQPALLTNF